MCSTGKAHFSAPFPFIFLVITHAHHCLEDLAQNLPFPKLSLAKLASY